MSSRVTSWRAWLVILAVVSVACDKKKADAPTEPKGSSASAAPSTKPSDVAAPTLSRKSEPAVPGDAGDAITKENFCDRLHAPLARLVKQRCTDADRQNLPAASAAHDRVLKVWPQTCRELMSPERVVLREQKARACIAAYDAYATAGFPPKVTMRMSWELPECASVFEGKQDVGAPCKGWADCKSGLFCVRREATADASLSEGTCKMHAKLGEACEKGYPAFDDTSNCENRELLQQQHVEVRAAAEGRRRVLVGARRLRRGSRVPSAQVRPPGARPPGGLVRRRRGLRPPARLRRGRRGRRCQVVRAAQSARAAMRGRFRVQGELREAPMRELLRLGLILVQARNEHQGT